MFPFREIRVLCAGGEAERGLIRYASMLADLAPDASIRYLRADAAEAATGAGLLLCAGGPGHRSIWSRWITSGSCPVWLVPPDAEPSIRGVLICLDPQPASREALRLGAAVASNSQLDHCVALHTYHIDGSICCDQCEIDLREQKTLEISTFAARVDSHGVDVHVTVEESLRPALTVSRALTGHDANLLVLSTPERLPLFGCGIEFMILEAGVPVLVVKTAESAARQPSLAGRLRFAPFALFRRSTA